MQIDFLQFLAKYYNTHGIQILFFSEAYEQLDQIDYGFHRQLFPDFDYRHNLNRIMKVIKPGVCYYIEDDFHLWYTVFLLTPELKESYNVNAIIIGPVFLAPMDGETFLETMENNNISPEYHDQIHEFYNRVPITGSFDSWFASTSTFFSTLARKTVDSVPLCLNDLTKYSPQYSYPIAQEPELSMKSIEERYQAEEEILTAVSQGKTEAALSALSRFRQYKLNPRTPDILRNTKNMLVILNTLLRKAAQIGHVHPMHIDHLSTQLAVQIEASTSFAALDSLRSLMVRKYCMLVKNHSTKAYSSLIQTCLDYIDFHYSEELSLDSIAKLCSVNNSYLSSQFKKEVNMTLTDYINSTRIRHSLLLLNATNHSIQEIAIRCGFSDSNYYARTFKKFQGMSPREYRELIRKGA